MSNTILVIGNSGTGKSSSLRTLKPEETFIINVLGKTLPFKGANKIYSKLSEDRTTGNTFSCDNSNTIIKVIKFVNEKRSDIKNLIIDDFTYSITNEYMSKILDKGFQKFSEMGKNAWQIMNDLSFCRPDLYSFVLSHSDRAEDGMIKCKTIGKLIDNTVCLEGMATVVLHSLVVDGEYKFLTQHDSLHLAKSPMGMFRDKLIPNDLQLVKEVMFEYFNEDISI